MATLTTREAAQKAGIPYGTLRRLVSSGDFDAPPLRKVKGGSTVRFWTMRDVERLRRYKAEHPRGRPPKRKKK